MSNNWLAGYDVNWTLEWLGACPGSTFGYSFPIIFDWSNDCGDEAAPFPGYGDSGVATLVLELENGYRIQHRWITDIIKSRAGGEQRISRNEIDHESFSGSAFLVDAEPRRIRALLARHAASGNAFLLGLPHEALALSGPSVGATVPVFSTALSDWTRPGQRVAVVELDDEGEPLVFGAIVQDASETEIDLSSSPGVDGGWIMPVRHVFLEPQQNFPRYEMNEAWNLDARSAYPMDFAPTLASLELGPLTVSAAFDDVSVVSRQFGPIGNSFMFSLQTGGPADGELVEADGEMQFSYSSGVTTLANLRDALLLSSFGILSGTYDPDDTIAAGDEFGLQFLTGAGEVGGAGTGATLTEYGGDGEDRPVWDREINVDGTITDGVHAMTKILDHGGIPYALPTADRADWFRGVSIKAGDQYDWQWFKLFMSTIRGRQVKFWLPTWREDLVYVSHSGDELVIDADEGDFTAWWPSQRQHVQIEQADGTITYAEITESENDGDERVLTLSVTLGVSPVTRICWLELCRFENADGYTTTHNQHGFDVDLVARVVP